MNDERIYSMLASVLTSVQTGIASLKVILAETNTRLDKLEFHANKMESARAAFFMQVEKLTAIQADLYEKTDRVESKTLKIEAGQTYINRKLDALAIEDVKLQKQVTAIHDELREQYKRVFTEVEALSSATKENMFEISKLRHKFGSPGGP